MKYTVLLKLGQDNLRWVISNTYIQLINVYNVDSISLEYFCKLRDSGVDVLDSRPTSQFSERYVPGSIGVSINGSFEYMINLFFPDKNKLILISQDERLSESLLRLEKEGFLEVSYFDINLWIRAEMECLQISRVKASKASNYLDKIVDVSNSEDWEVLHVKGVSNVPLVDLITWPEKVGSGSVLYCGNGHKSMAAVSFLSKRDIVTTDITGGLSAMLVDSPDLEI